MKQVGNTGEYTVFVTEKEWDIKIKSNLCPFHLQGSSSNYSNLCTHYGIYENCESGKCPLKTED